MACAPPPRNATGTSRPIAADGTDRYSTLDAAAVADVPIANPIVNRSVSPTLLMIIIALFTDCIAFVPRPSEVIDCCGGAPIRLTSGVRQHDRCNVAT